MRSYVLDASVAAKWFLPPAQETLSGESLDLLHQYAGGNIRLIVPDLFWPESGNILWKAARNGRISRKSAEESMLALTGLKIATSPTLGLLEDAWAIAMAFDRTVYDCIYVALAVASRRPLVTADERLANALASRFPVRWLGSATLD